MREDSTAEFLIDVTLAEIRTRNNESSYVASLYDRRGLAVGFEHS